MIAKANNESVLSDGEGKTTGRSAESQRGVRQQSTRTWK